MVTVDVNTASSAYDSTNRRVKKTAGGITTHYVWEGSQVIAEYNGVTGALISEYVFAGSRMVAREQSAVLRYFLQDPLSTRLITDSTGNLVGREDHLPFGEDAATGSGESEKHRFTSYERDNESGTDYAINRQYSPSTARFSRPDPFDASYDLSNPQSFNRYTYVTDDPTNMVDPLGLVKICNPSLVNPGCWVCIEDNGSLIVDCRPRDVLTIDPRRGPIPPPDRPDRPEPPKGPDKPRVPEVIRALAGPCLGTAWQNWKITNNFLFAKPGGGLLRFGVGLLTGGAVANQEGLVSFGQLARAILTGSRTITTGGATFTLLEGAILSLPNAALNSVLVGGAMEAGVTVGSFFNKDCFRFSVPTTFVVVPRR
jgi:RHS repeat-associated protein